MSRVFVVQEQLNINITPALDFGDEFVYMLPPGNHAFNPTRMGEVFEDKFEKHNFGADDYMLLIGDPVAIASAAIHAMYRLKGSKLKVLKWDRQSSRYFPVEI